MTSNKEQWKSKPNPAYKGDSHKYHILSPLWWQLLRISKCTYSVVYPQRSASSLPSKIPPQRSFITVQPKNFHGSSAICPMDFIYSIQICEISHQKIGPSHRKCSREREREIKFIGLFGDRGHRGPYSPYKPCNHNLYIGIINHLPSCPMIFVNTVIHFHFLAFHMNSIWWQIIILIHWMCSVNMALRSIKCKRNYANTSAKLMLVLNGHCWEKVS